MLMDIWQTFLFQPVFNALIWVYNHWTDANLGWAIIYLTLLLRLALLPFSIFSERARYKNSQLNDDIARLQKDLANDPILYKEELRKLLKKKKIRPWAKAALLGVQGIVLILLYQVFLQGMAAELVIHLLYPSVSFPGRIDTVFYGFSLGDTHNIVWAGLIAGLLIVEEYIRYRKTGREVTTKDLSYFVFFPLTIFVVLYILPMAKSLFVLTSVVFSMLTNKLIALIYASTQQESDEV